MRVDLDVVSEVNDVEGGARGVDDAVVDDAGDDEGFPLASATLTAWSSTEVVLRLTTCASRPHGLTK